MASAGLCGRETGERASNRKSTQLFQVRVVPLFLCPFPFNITSVLLLPLPLRTYTKIANLHLALSLSHKCARAGRRQYQKIMLKVPTTREFPWSVWVMHTAAAASLFLLYRSRSLLCLFLVVDPFRSAQNTCSQLTLFFVRSSPFRRAQNERKGDQGQTSPLPRFQSPRVRALCCISLSLFLSLSFCSQSALLWEQESAAKAPSFPRFCWGDPP